MARPHPSLIELAAGRPLPQHLGDPITLVQSAAEHRVAPLLAATLSGEGRSLGAVADRLLAFEDLAGRSRHDHAVATLEHAVQRLTDAGFSIGTAKGVSAARRWWPDPRLRPCNDIDLFINPTDMDRMDDLVAALDSGNSLLGNVARLAKRGTLQYVSVLSDNHAHLSIDLHVDVMNLLVRTRQLDLLWARTMSSPLANGTTVRVLDPSLALVHLVINQLRDGFPFLLNLVDLRYALADPGLDWNVVADFVSGEGWEALVFGPTQACCAKLAIPYEGPPPPRGWRAHLANALYPERRYLGGQANLFTTWGRELVLPLAGEGRRSELVGNLFRRFFLPRDLIEDRSGRSGPYPLLLANYRVRQQIWLRGRRHTYRSDDA